MATINCTYHIGSATLNKSGLLLSETWDTGYDTIKNVDVGTLQVYVNSNNIATKTITYNKEDRRGTNVNVGANKFYWYHYTDIPEECTGSATLNYYNSGENDLYVQITALSGQALIHYENNYPIDIVFGTHSPTIISSGYGTYTLPASTDINSGYSSSGDWDLYNNNSFSTEISRGISGGTGMQSLQTILSNNGYQGKGDFYIRPAGWKVTYVPDNGEDSNTVVITKGHSYINTPSKSGGYSFDGWYDVYGNKIVEPGAGYTPTGDITLYAHWILEPVGQTINGYTYNGCKLIISNCEYGKTIPYPGGVSKTHFRLQYTAATPNGPTSWWSANGTDSNGNILVEGDKVNGASPGGIIQARWTQEYKEGLTWTPAVTYPPPNDTYYNAGTRLQPWIKLSQLLRLPEPVQTYASVNFDDPNLKLSDYGWWVRPTENENRKEGLIFSAWWAKTTEYDNYIEDTVQFLNQRQEITLYPHWTRANNVKYIFKALDNNQVKLGEFPTIRRKSSGNELVFNPEIDRFEVVPEKEHRANAFYIEWYQYLYNNPNNLDNLKNIISAHSICPLYKDGYYYSSDIPLYNSEDYLKNSSFSLLKDANLLFRFYDGTQGFKSENSLVSNIFTGTRWILKDSSDIVYDSNGIGWCYTPTIGDEDISAIKYEGTKIELNSRLMPLRYPITYGNWRLDSEKYNFDFVLNVSENGSYKLASESDLPTDALDTLKYKVGTGIVGIERNGSIIESSYTAPEFLFEIDLENSTKEIDILNNNIEIYFSKLIKDTNSPYYNYKISSGYNFKRIFTRVIRPLKYGEYLSNIPIDDSETSLKFDGSNGTISFTVPKSKIPVFYSFTPVFEPKTANIKFKCDDFDVDGDIPEDVSGYYYEKYISSKFDMWKNIKLKPKNKRPGEISSLTITGWSTKINGQDIQIFDKDFMPTEEAMNKGFIYKNGNTFHFTPNLESSTDVYLSPIVEYNGFISVYDSGWNEAVKVYVSDGTYGWHEVPLNYLDSGS